MLEKGIERTLKVEKLESQIARETIGFSGLKYLEFGISLGTQIIFARLLAPDVFGTIALASAILGILGLLGRWGLDAAIMQDEEEIGGVLTSTIFWLRVVYAVLFVLAILAVAPILAGFYSRTVVQVVLIMTAFSALSAVSSVSQQVMRKHLMLSRMGGIQLASHGFSSIVGVALAMSGYGVWSLVIYQVMKQLLNAIGSFVFSPFRPSFNFDLQRAKWFLRFAGNAAIAEMIGFVVHGRGDDLILGSVSGTVELGFYSISFRLSKILHTMGAANFFVGLLPAFSKINRDSAKKLNKAYEFALRNVAYITIPFYFLLTIGAREIVSLVYGPKWLPAAPILQVLVVYAILGQLTGVDKTLHYAIGQPRAFLLARLGAVFAFLISVFPLTFKFGAVGTALSLDIAMIASTIIWDRQTFKTTGVRHLKVLGAPLLAAIISGCLALIVRLLIHNSLVVRLVVTSLIFVTCYGLVLFGLRGAQIKNDMRRVFKMLPSPSCGMIGDLNNDK